MTDSQFTKLLQRAAKAQNKAGDLLKQCESEYERRYGENPSDIDDDMWIDAMHYGATGACSEHITAKDVDNGAVQYGGMKSCMPTS